MTPKKELRETVELMLSEDAIDQLKAEYYQLENRLIALNQELLEYDLDPANSDNRVNPERNLLGEKLAIMRNYLNVLQREARMKDIEL